MSLGAKLRIDILKTVREWFLKNEIINFGNPGENFLRSKLLPHNFDNDREVQKKVVDYFSSFDESIKDFLIIKNNEENDEVEKKGTSLIIKTLHKMNDSDDMEELNLKEKSSGTLKMFSLYPSIQSALELGSLLFIDEFNSRLHPLLVRSIIQLFENPKINKNNAQLIFTTHDVWQLSNDLLRRDESYGKNYVVGKYGAIPNIKESWTCCDEFAKLYLKKTGQKYEKSGKGTYKCTKDGQIVVLDDNTDTLPPCPKCHNTTYTKIG